MLSNEEVAVRNHRWVSPLVLVLMQKKHREHGRCQPWWRCLEEFLRERRGIWHFYLKTGKCFSGTSFCISSPQWPVNKGGQSQAVRDPNQGFAADTGR